MAKVLITVSKADENGVNQSFVTIDDRVLPFQTMPSIDIYVEADTEHTVSVFCEGPKGASTTVALTKKLVPIIPSLKARVATNYGAGFATDVFTVRS